MGGAEIFFEPLFFFELLAAPVPLFLLSSQLTRTDNGESSRKWWQMRSLVGPADVVPTYFTFVSYFHINLSIFSYF